MHQPLVVDYKTKFPVSNSQNSLNQEVEKNEFEISRIKNGLSNDNICKYCSDHN